MALRRPVPCHTSGSSLRQRLGWLGWTVLIIAVVLGIRLVGALLRAFTGGDRTGGGGFSPGSGSGGGMLGGVISGLFGAFAGNWLYHSMFGNNANAGEPSGYGEHDHGDDHPGDEHDHGAGGDFDSGDFDSGDFDSGDSGSDSRGDFGGGDFGGADFGDSDSDGGGDFGSEI